MGLISFFIASSLSVLFGEICGTFLAKMIALSIFNLIVSRICLVCEFVFNFLKLSCVFHIPSTDALIEILT